MNAKDLLNKRVLVSVLKDDDNTTKSVDEAEIREISPSGDWIKVRSSRGLIWERTSDVNIVEVLNSPSLNMCEDK